MVKANSYSFKRMEQCLECSTCHDVICKLVGSITKDDYFNYFFNVTTSKDKNIKKHIANLLGHEESTEIVEELVSDMDTDLVTDQYISPCVASIKMITSPLRDFFVKEKEIDTPKKSDYRLRERTANKSNYSVWKTKALELMHEINKKYSDTGDYYDFKEFDAVLCEIRKKRAKYEPADPQAFSDLVQNVLECYCDTAEIDEKNQTCWADLFRFALKQIKKPSGKKKEIIARWKKLDCKAQEIFFEYLRHAPKKFGYNLSQLMLVHSSDSYSFTQQSLVNLLDIKISSAQSLLKNDAPPKNEETVQKLCDCFMVTKDVLISGEGKIYMFWSDFLSEESIKLFKTDEVIQAYLQNKGERGDTDFSAKQRIIEEIIGILKRDNFDFQLLCNKYPDWIIEEDICLYEYQGVFDYGKMYEQLLHPEEADTLLSVLESLSE